jgi:hypothetical protein
MPIRPLDEMAPTIAAAALALWLLIRPIIL